MGRVEHLVLVVEDEMQGVAHPLVVIDDQHHRAGRARSWGRFHVRLHLDESGCGGGF